MSSRKKIIVVIQQTAGSASLSRQIFFVEKARQPAVFSPLSQDKG
jgi:hypothetical protein